MLSKRKVQENKDSKHDVYVTENHPTKTLLFFCHTFAKMLDHVGSCTLWAAAASKNFVVRGADASNAFAEASAPKIPLYVHVDQPF